MSVIPTRAQASFTRPREPNYALFGFLLFFTALCRLFFFCGTAYT
jgi:hypothetical protein